MHFEALIFVALIVIAYLIGKSNISKLVERIGRERNVASARIQYVNKVLSIIFTALAVAASAMIIGIQLNDLGVLFGSLFAVLGVALFAQWSMLSNITASIIVFFFFPYRVGDFVKIIDGENSISGTIKEIALFHVILDGEQGSIVTYPNSLIFQRAVVIDPATSTAAQQPAPNGFPNELETTPSEREKQP
jgi:small-conductance mechanosensitive channel